MIRIDETNYEQIFGVFQRLHGRSEYEGNEVRPAIYKKKKKKTVERHGDTIKTSIFVIFAILIFEFYNFNPNLLFYRKIINI